jgi:hypothetical protein
MVLQCCPYIAALHTLGNVPTICPPHCANTVSGMGNEWGGLKSDGSVCLPPRLLPRMDVLTPDGIYFAFNGSFLYVWLGKACDVNCVNELFGFASVDQADGTSTLP